MNILLNSKHELRSGWKYLLFWVLFGMMLYTLAVALSLPAVPETQLGRLTVNLIPILPAILVLWIMAKFVDKVPMATFGVTLHEKWPRDLGYGVGLSIAMLAAVTLTNAVLGGITMTWTASDATIQSLIVTPFVLIVSAATEELVFRGYPFQVLLKGIGIWPALLTMSTFFGLIHLSNDNATILGAVNTILAGVMLSIAYLKTRSLWIPYGLHVGWNIGLGFVLGYPLSGIDIDSLWTTSTGGPAWLVGTAYGPEGGLVGTLVFIAATLVIRSTKKVGISPTLEKLHYGELKS